MSTGSSINLELYWLGAYNYNTWDISTVDIKMKDSTHKISAHINKDLPSTQEQRLHFTVSKKGESFFGRDNECPNIECPIDLVKSMKVSARIFQTYENRSMMIRQFDGSYTYETRARIDDLPVFIDEFPTFESTETYQIKIVSQNNNLRATLEKKVSEIASQKMPDAKTTNETSEKQPEELEQLGLAFEGLGRMIGAASLHNPELDADTISELEGRLEIANRKLIATRSSFDAACQSRDPSRMMHELTEKQKIMQEVIGLQRALEGRGVPQKDLSSPECVIS